MAVDDIIGLEVQGSLNAGLWQMKFYYKITADATPEGDNPIAVSAGWDGKVRGPLLESVSTEMTVDCATAQKVFPTPVGNTFITPLAGSSGDLTGESLPATNAAIITLLTAVTGAQTRGRKYIPGIRELDQQGGRIKAACLLLLGTLATSMLASIGDGTMTAVPVIAHRNPLTPFDVLSTEQLTQFTVRPRLGNQRRRKTFRTNFSAV